MTNRTTCFYRHDLLIHWKIGIDVAADPFDVIGRDALAYLGVRDDDVPARFVLWRNVGTSV